MANASMIIALLLDYKGGRCIITLSVEEGDDDANNVRVLMEERDKISLDTLRSFG